VAKLNFEKFLDRRGGVFKHFVGYKTALGGNLLKCDKIPITTFTNKQDSINVV